MLNYYKSNISLLLDKYIKSQIINQYVYSIIYLYNTSIYEYGLLQFNIKRTASSEKNNKNKTLL